MSIGNMEINCLKISTVKKTSDVVKIMKVLPLKKYGSNMGKFSGLFKSINDITTPRSPMYVCKQYEKAFTCSCSLQRHERIQTGKKHYVYKQCGNIFTFYTSYIVHERVHCGEKLFI